jgi:hypothetical protein
VIARDPVNHALPSKEVVSTIRIPRTLTLAVQRLKLVGLVVDPKRNAS